MEEKKLMHKLSLQNRQNLQISGVEKVVSSNTSSIIVKLSDTNLEICGSDLSIESFIDFNLDIVGKIDALKYTKTSKSKECFFKRIFK